MRGERGEGGEGGIRGSEGGGVIGGGRLMKMRMMLPHLSLSLVQQDMFVTVL